MQKEIRALNKTEFVFPQAQQPFTVIYNNISDNNKIEYATQGVFLQIVRFKNNIHHKIYMEGLIGDKGTKATVSRAVFNLRMEGFLDRQKIRDEKGRLVGYQYMVYEQPLHLTDEQKTEIITESRTNVELATVMYPELWPLYREYFISSFTAHSTESKVKVQNKKIAEFDNTYGVQNTTPCVPIVSSDFRSTEIGSTEIGSTDTKKENELKNKISKNKNDNDYSTQSLVTTEEQPKESSSSLPTDISVLDEKEKEVAAKLDEVQSITIDEEFIKSFKDKWIECVGKRVILSQANKVKLMDMSNEYGQAEVLEALNRIPESNYLKANITITNFINKFERIANNEYANREKIENNSTTVPNKVAQFNNMYTHDWDFDQLEALEREHINKKIEEMNAERIAEGKCTLAEIYPAANSSSSIHDDILEMVASY